MQRKNTKQVYIKGRAIGGGAPILVQSMLNVPSTDIRGSVEQAKRLERAGCDIIRLAIPDMQAVSLIGAIKQEVSVPLVADIHFDYRLALASLEAGIDKIRLNPGNISNREHIKLVAQKANEKGVAIRIGVNSGSLEKEILQKYGKVCPQALVESALYHASLLEQFDFHNIVVSIKSSDVPTMIEAYTLMSKQSDYPLHLGVTEAGGLRTGVVKSSIGIGHLLLNGIGDTIRVSLTADPVEEVKAGKDILRALGLYSQGVEIVSCPTCGRTRIDLIAIANRLEEALEGVNKPLKVAVMGCVVNGPGEAREADIGIAGGDGCAVIFKKGQVVRKIPEEEIVPQLLNEIQNM